jgi:hypothetical protein
MGPMLPARGSVLPHVSRCTARFVLGTSPALHMAVALRFMLRHVASHALQHTTLHRTHCNTQRCITRIAAHNVAAHTLQHTTLQHTATRCHAARHVAQCRVCAQGQPARHADGLRVRRATFGLPAAAAARTTAAIVPSRLRINTRR